MGSCHSRPGPPRGLLPGAEEASGHGRSPSPPLPGQACPSPSPPAAPGASSLSSPPPLAGSSRPSLRLSWPVAGPMREPGEGRACGAEAASESRVPSTDGAARSPVSPGAWRPGMDVPSRGRRASEFSGTELRVQCSWPLGPLLLPFLFVFFTYCQAVNLTPFLTVLRQTIRSSSGD